MHPPLVLIAVLACLFLPAPLARCAGQADSLIRQIGAMAASERLDAYADACNKASAWADAGDALRLFCAYRNEASRSGSAKHEANARILRLYAFYNHCMADSLDAYLDKDLRFLEQHGEWEFYYSCWSLRVERLSYDNRLQSALRESQSMYADALRRKSVYGRGMSAYLIAASYQSMSRNEEAVGYFEEAERCFLENPNVGQMHNLYGMAWQSFSAIERYDEVLSMVARWEQMWTHYCEENSCSFDDIAGYYIVCILAKAHVYIRQGNLEAAQAELSEASELANKSGLVSQQLYLKEEALYYEAEGEWEKALGFVEKRRAIQQDVNNRTGLVESDEIYARLLAHLGRFAEAVHVYGELVAKKDSLANSAMAAQLDDMAIVYKLDKIEAEKELLRVWMIAAFSLCGFLLLSVAAFVVYKRILRRKNKAIGKHMRETLRTEKQINALMRKMPETSLNKDEQVFLQINNLLQDISVLTDPAMKRELLAKKLGYNRNVVISAIKTCAGGMEVMAYINRLRVEYACELIAQEKGLTVRVLAERCGFNSHTTFIRVFKEYTGMTPANYYKSIAENGR